MANLSNINNKFIVSDAGHVSIGTTTTTYPLTVESGGVGTVLRAGTAFVSIDSVGTAASPSLIFNGDSNTGIWRAAADTLAFSTAGTERMRIDSAGNVGIGTLTIGADLHIERTASSPSLLVKAAGQTSSLTPTATLVLAPGSSSGYSTGPKITGYRTADFSITALRSTGLKFSVSSANVEVDAMWINSAGNVGIGTGGYAQKPLDVSGVTGGQVLITSADDAVGSSAGILLRAEGGEANGLARVKGGIFFERIAGTYGNGKLKFAVNSSVNNDAVTVADTAITIDTNKNVGIGTDSPAQQLEILYPSYIDKDTVEGVIRLVGQTNVENPGSNTFSGGVGIEFYNKWTGGSPYSTGRISARSSPSYDGGLQFDVSQNTGPGQTNFITAMSIIDTGNVGIGTTSPSNKLEVSETTTWNVANFKSSHTTGSGITMHSTDTGAQWSLITQGTTGGANDNNLAFHLTNAGTSGEALGYKVTLEAGGNVGIGTSSPAAKLDVLGLDINIGADNGAPTTRTNSTVKVGVITSPHYTTAEENFTGMLFVGNTTVNEVAIGGGTSTYNSATQIKFYTGANSTTVLGTERMRISSNGNVSMVASENNIYANEIAAGATTLCLLWPMASNGAHFSGTFISDNWDQPSSFYIAIADKYSNTSAIWAYGIKHYGSYGLDFVKYSYGSVDYVAIRMNTGSPTNRNWRFTGNTASFNPTPVAYVSSSVISVLYSIPN